jgi:hypothetical protein
MAHWKRKENLSPGRKEGPRNVARLSSASKICDRKR